MTVTLSRSEIEDRLERLRRLRDLRQIEDDRRRAGREALEADWHSWLRQLFPAYVLHPFAPHHRQLWAWVWGIRPQVEPEAFVAVWARGGAKSTTAELALVALAARRARRYGLYICATQDQADDHVGNVAALLEAPHLAARYPELSERAVGKYGSSKGWRRNRLRTSSGFTLDAIGLDTAARGVKMEDARPDVMVLDDIDGEHDSVATTAKKVATLTKALLPAGTADLAVLAIQNLVHEQSVFATLVDGRAEFLANRVVSGPIPALEGAAYEQDPDGRWLVVDGTPTWAGQDLASCQALIGRIGLSAFRQESQHEVEAPPGGMFDHLTFRHCRWDEIPDLVRTVVWVDPAVTDTDESDSMGIQADGLAADGTVYRLWSWEQRTSPLDAVKRAIRKAVELNAQHVGVETDQGGDTWRSVYREAVAELERAGEIPDRPPRFTHDKAGAGYGPKVHRAGQMLADYERGVFVHVLGTHHTLERALRRFPKTKPYDLVDASFWSWRDLVPPGGGKAKWGGRQAAGTVLDGPGFGGRQATAAQIGGR